MKQGLYTSGFLHLFLGFLLLTNFKLIENNPDTFLNDVDVKLVSEQELIELTKIDQSRTIKPEQSSSENVVQQDTRTKKFDSALESNAGNELKGVSDIDNTQIKKRKTKEEIIADRAEKGENQDENLEVSKNNKPLKENNTANKIKIDKADRKNTSSHISHEGKNVEIVTGALSIAKVPPRKPKTLERPLKDSDLTTEKEASVYNDLVNQVVNREKEENNVESSVENLAKARILQILNDNWNVLSINRLPNYEKYVIILELRIDQNGKISGPIKVIYPENIAGNFIIAKRSAVKAVLESTPFPVPKESFPKGLILRVVFDPETNVGVNNG